MSSQDERSEISKGAAPSLPALLFGAVVLAAAAALLLAVLDRSAPIATLGGCNQPAKLGEQLHVVIVMRDGKPKVIDCMYVGGRGTYGIKR